MLARLFIIVTWKKFNCLGVAGNWRTMGVALGEKKKRSPGLWYSVFDADAHAGQGLYYLLHGGLVRKGEHNRRCK
jgi:hypothetical protein